MGKVTCINNNLLVWARNIMHYSQHYVAEKMGKSIETIINWENGEDYPTYVQLEKLADLYNKPIAIFFFDDEPEIPNIPQSFRSISITEYSHISPNVVKVIHKNYLLQQNLIDIIPNLKSNFYNLKLNNLKNLEEKLRVILGVTLDSQKSFRNEHIAFEKWREAFYDIGIYVFKDVFYDDSISGFCLYDIDYPVIVVNNSMTFNRQIFTLFHELYHLIEGTSGIDFNDIVENTSSDIERECDQFTSNFLIPSFDLLKEIKNHNIDYNLINDLSVKYKVSRQAILIKLYNLKMLSFNDYRYYSSIIITTYKRIRKDESKGNYYTTICSYLGKNYLKNCLRLYSYGNISLSSLCLYTNSNMKTIGGIIETTNRYR